MRGRWTASLAAALGFWAAGAGAQEYSWRPVSAAATVAPDRPAATLGRPVATLGRPIPLTAAPPAEAYAPQVTPAGYSASAATLGPIIRAQAPDAGPPPVPPPGVPAVPGPPPGPVVGVPAVPADPVYGGPPAGPAAGGFWSRAGELFGFGTPSPGRGFLQSDHCFDEFASPVTNPFQFEDPRALTEVRPIFMYQTVQRSNPFFRRESIQDYNLQARVAITDRLSVVMQEFGFVHIGADRDSRFSDQTGLSEIQIGPKFTFYRCDQTGTVAAAGLTFDIPAGPKKVFQDTGMLTLRPYLSFAQNFGHTSYGSFNFMSTFGYNFGTDNSRSDNFFSSYHLDFNVANANKIYPFVELTWRHYTANGGVEPAFNFEGGDLFNFGSEHVAGKDFLSVAPGVRYKFTEWAQIGTAVEFPVLRSHDIENFRWTIDLIFRY